MRQVTRNASNAFVSKSNGSFSNTTVQGDAMYLHGNKIAEYRNGELWITNAGWATNTTKERLNGLPNVSIRQANFVWYLNGKEWNGSWIKV